MLMLFCFKFRFKNPHPQPTHSEHTQLSGFVLSSLKDREEKFPFSYFYWLTRIAFPWRKALYGSFLIFDKDLIYK